MKKIALILLVGFSIALNTHSQSIDELIKARANDPRVIEAEKQAKEIKKLEDELALLEEKKAEIQEKLRDMQPNEPYEHYVGTSPGGYNHYVSNIYPYHFTTFEGRIIQRPPL